MPRLNRDFQRRLAARRERERRRPNPDRRYRFGSPESAAEPEATLEQDEATEATEVTEAPRERAPRATRAATDGTQAPSTRGGARAAPRPFSAYKDEYAYVYSDLRRVAVVIGSLLLVLIVLFFVLPALIH
jgi:hypothetical protein